MAPTLIQPASVSVDSNLKVKSSLQSKPLSNSGSLDGFKQFDSTTAIGREFPEAQLVEWITSENADTLLRDLAITSTLRLLTFLTNSLPTWGCFFPQPKRLHSSVAESTCSKVG